MKATHTYDANSVTIRRLNKRVKLVWDQDRIVVLFANRSKDDRYVGAPTAICDNKRGVDYTLIAISEEGARDLIDALTQMVEQVIPKARKK